MINIELSFINKNLLKKKARFQKYDSKEPGGVKSTTVEIKVIMADEEKKQYTGYGYHGGGRKATGVKRVSICISGQPEQIEKLKKMAAQEEKTVSAFVLEKTGVMK